jgi:hypothetical protein
VIVLRGLIARLAFVGVALIGGVGAPLYLAHHDGAPAAALAQGVGNFDGPWYFGGDLTAAALINQAGTSLTLMNEQGRVANGVANNVQLRADWGQGPITGTLTSDQRQINWDNGTFWQRRALVDTASLGGNPNIGGIWSVGDNAAARALIVQQPNGALSFINEQGRPSPGRFNSPNTFVATAWDGVSGTLSPDGNFINWNNGTNWRR